MYENKRNAIEMRYIRGRIIIISLQTFTAGRKSYRTFTLTCGSVATTANVSESNAKLE